MHTPTDRVQNHAKLLTHDNRQFLAYLYRDDDDALCVALQTWVAVTDEQHRAVIRAAGDERAAQLFASLTDDTLGDAVRQLGILDDIENLEESFQ